MNQKQLKIIELASIKNIWSMSLRKIGHEIGEKNAGTVKYHLDKLIKSGTLKKPNEKEALKKFQGWIEKSHEALLNIPILGTANCGIATLVGKEMFDGYLKVSPSLVPTNNHNNLFAVNTKGNSLNTANIGGQNVNSGDYLIIDTNLSPQNGQYVLSIIDGCANIKKYRKEGGKIVLESESTEETPPIFIDKDTDYLVNGVVIKVIKNYEEGDENRK